MGAIISTLVLHPFGASVVIGAVASGVATVVKSFKGRTTPTVVINTTSETKEDDT